MQKLFVLSFALMIASSLFVGHAFSKGYAPYFGIIAGVFFLLAVFLPFLSEYNILHRGFSSIGDNFKSLMHSEEPTKGEVEILLPSHMNQTAKTYQLHESGNIKIGLWVIILIGVVFLAIDGVDFYVLGDGLKSDNGPISNF